MSRVRSPRLGLLAAALLLALGAAWPLSEPEARRLLLEGRYAQAYAQLRGQDDVSGAGARERYLLACAAYHCLQLGEAAALLEGSAPLPHPSGWLPAETMRRRIDSVAPRFPVGRTVRPAGRAAIYLVFAHEREGLAERLAAAAPAAHAAASGIAFGSHEPPAGAPPVALYVLASNREAAEFFSGLGLRAPTEGSAVTVGLGVVTWETRDGASTFPHPYRAEATLAHETVHAFQALLGVDYGPRWTIEGAAQLAEDAVDPNHALLTREAALHLLARDSRAPLAVIQTGAEAHYASYPVYYLLADTLRASHGLPAMGAAMAELNRYDARPVEDVLEDHFGLTPEALSDLCVARAASDEWAAARDLRAVRARLASRDGVPAHELAGLAERWPSEPYLRHLAARAYAEEGAAVEAAARARDLIEEGYLGSRDGDPRDLLEDKGDAR